MSLPDKLLEFVRGDREAFAFLMDVYDIVEIWDDLIDKDKPVDDVVLNATFYRALITLPRNPFYHKHFLDLNPVFEAAILDWYTANALEKTGVTEHLYTSYGLRRGVQMLAIMAARIIGGVEWANKVSFDMGSTGDQTWAEYASEFKVA